MRKVARPSRWQPVPGPKPEPKLELEPPMLYIETQVIPTWEGSYGDPALTMRMTTWINTSMDTRDPVLNEELCKYWVQEVTKRGYRCNGTPSITVSEGSLITAGEEELWPAYRRYMTRFEGSVEVRRHPQWT